MKCNLTYYFCKAGQINQLLLFPAQYTEFVESDEKNILDSGVQLLHISDSLLTGEIHILGWGNLSTGRTLGRLSRSLYKALGDREIGEKSRERIRLEVFIIHSEGNVK